MSCLVRHHPSRPPRVTGCGNRRLHGPGAYPVTVIVYVTSWLTGPNVGVPDSAATKLM